MKVAVSIHTGNLLSGRRVIVEILLSLSGVQAVSTILNIVHLFTMQNIKSHPTGLCHAPPVVTKVTIGLVIRPVGRVVITPAYSQDATQINLF